MGGFESRISSPGLNAVARYRVSLLTGEMGIRLRRLSKGLGSLQGSDSMEQERWMWMGNREGNWDRYQLVA
jgi:hypothetical protein